MNDWSIEIMSHPSYAREWANAWAPTSKRAYPHLPVAWHLPTLLEWMQTYDPNGEWTCAPDDDPVTLEDALYVLGEWAMEAEKERRREWHEFRIRNERVEHGMNLAIHQLKADIDAGIIPATVRDYDHLATLCDATRYGYVKGYDEWTMSHVRASLNHRIQSGFFGAKVVRHECCDWVVTFGHAPLCPHHN